MSEEGKATAGILAANGDRIESKGDHGWINDGWIIAKCEGPDAFANARRLVACWNSCEAMDTDLLENSEWIKLVASEMKRLADERAELAAEVKRLERERLAQDFRKKAGLE
jgi:hypothetical protein